MTVQRGSPWTLPLASQEAPLGRVGGKGASLMRLATSGIPVPPGFLITTEAYRRFVAENTLQAVIDNTLRGVDGSDPVSLERGVATIQDAFARATVVQAIAAAVQQAYAALGEPEPAVAVRSSATAEDLPGLSFAGQQETFLDVRGDTPLLDAIRRAWASLWTARAIAYRQQMGVGHERVAMALVVQVMVPAEVSGVLFTANPATGNRSELVIEAVFGLGEGIVGGTVTPESYVIARDSLAITRVMPGARDALDTSPGEGSAAPSDGGALPDLLVRDLAELGSRVERLFGGTPQDIEWAVADDRLWLLQARPITTLPPAIPVVWESPEPGASWVRRQVVEHMPEPLSPLFAELYVRQGFEQSLAAIATIPAVTGAEDLFARLIGGPFLTTVNGYGYSRASYPLPREELPQTLLAIVRWFRWFLRHGVDYWQEDGLPAYLATIAHWQTVDPATAGDAELLRGVRELAVADAVYWFPAAIAIGLAKISDSLLDTFLRRLALASNLRSALFLRGFPSKTLEAEAELDAIARRVRESEALREDVMATPAERLLDALPDTPAGRRLRDDLEHYFARYGHQIYNLDFAAPTLVEAPLPVLLALKSLVREPGMDALTRQEAMARERDELTEETDRSFDPLRRFVFRRLVRWAQRLAPYREDALFYLGAAWPPLRRFALELGQRLAEAGALGAADDVFFLESEELETAIAARAAGVARPDLVRLARDRRALREEQRRLHPPPAVPPTAGLRWGPFDLSSRETQRRNLADATTLRGFAVSPGRVTAPASVIRSPADFGQMEPGTILVCPTTTPAWTPLFAQARGLVTDVGGILAHGSIIAREYGIPAVMGTGNATQRVVSGQQLAVDGSAGTVTLVD
jgi:rifampicin phosphotransferase